MSKLNTIYIPLDTIYIAKKGSKMGQCGNKLTINMLILLNNLCCTITYWYYYWIYTLKTCLQPIDIIELFVTYWYYNWIYHPLNLLILLNNSRRSRWFWKIKNVYIIDIIEQFPIFSKFLPTPPLAPLHPWI